MVPPCPPRFVRKPLVPPRIADGDAPSTCSTSRLASALGRARELAFQEDRVCVGLLHDGTAMPMAWVILGCSAISVFFLVTMIRR